jgi:hypothetical protein
MQIYLKLIKDILEVYYAILEFGKIELFSWIKKSHTKNYPCYNRTATTKKI